MRSSEVAQPAQTATTSNAHKTLILPLPVEPVRGRHGLLAHWRLNCASPQACSGDTAGEIAALEWALTMVLGRRLARVPDRPALAPPPRKCGLTRTPTLPSRLGCSFPRLRCWRLAAGTMAAVRRLRGLSCPGGFEAFAEHRPQRQSSVLA